MQISPPRSPWWKRLLSAVGASLERVGRALNRASGGQDDGNGLDGNGLPNHWLELLTSSKIPLVWLRREAKAGERRSSALGWQPNMLWPRESPRSSLTSPLYRAEEGKSRKTNPPNRFRKFQKPLSSTGSRRASRLARREAETNPAGDAPFFRMEREPVSLLSTPRTSAAKVRFPDLRLVSKSGPPRAPQILQNTPAEEPAARARTQDRGSANPGTPVDPDDSLQFSAAVKPQRNTAFPVSPVNPSSGSLGSGLFAPETWPADSWPDLPEDWLADELEQPPQMIQRDRQQKLEREQRGEQSTWNG
jgi:hypothetical protein